MTNITTNYIKLNSYPSTHKTIIIIRATGEIVEEFNYNYIFWKPFQDIFSKYQKQHIAFDVYTDGEKNTKLFRHYQQTSKGTWVKKAY